MNQLSLFITVLVAGSTPALVSLGAVLPQEPASSSARQPSAPNSDAPPTLDELLGITKDKDPGSESKTDIIEKLTGGEEEGAGVDVSAVFLEAVESMEKSASLLIDERSAGLATQRYQEDALLKLDTLIAQAQRQGKPQPQPQSQQSQQQRPPQQQQQSQNQSPGSNASQEGDNRPGMRQTDLDGAIEEKGTEWGNLPPRVRELLRQGRGDSAARLYERLTEIYYQRLAEESQP